MGYYPDEEDFEGDFLEVDADGDGHLSVDETLKYVEKQVEITQNQGRSCGNGNGFSEALNRLTSQFVTDNSHNQGQQFHSFSSPFAP